MAGFYSPATPAQVTASLAAGAAVTTLAGSVTTATEAQQSALDVAVIQGLLPSGIDYTTAAARISHGSGVSTTLVSTTVDVLGPVATWQYVLKLVVCTCSAVGVQQWAVFEATPANVFVQYAALGMVDASKTALLIPFGAGLALAKGNKVRVNVPATAGTYQVYCVYDLLVFP